MIINLITGLNPTKTRNGFTELGNKLEFLGHNVFQSQYDDKTFKKADCVIAHSFGGSTTIKQLKNDKELKLKLLILLDAVPENSWFWPFSFDWKISDQVGITHCYYRGALIPPYSQKIKNEDKTRINYYFKGWHGDYPENKELQDKIITHVKDLITV